MAIDMTNLKNHIKDHIIQKFRIDETIVDYQKMDVKLRELIIDQKDLLNQLPDKTSEQYLIIEERMAKNQEIRDKVQNIIQAFLQTRDYTIQVAQKHLPEVTRSEFNSGGFYIHYFATDPNSSFNETDHTLEINKGGHAETLMGVHTDHWKDNSQLTIKIINS